MKKGIIVIDIGMTNKKVAVYDEQLFQMEVAYKNFEPVTIQDSYTDDNLPVYNLSAIKSWFGEQIRNFSSKYQIEAISVTTHGATAVCIDEKGEVTVPCVFYTYEPGEEFQKKFYEICGSPEDLQRETLTPELSAMINLAKGIFFAKEHFPNSFEKTKTILNFPQYWTYLLTGKKVYEQTFPACHTYLWNHEKKTWSSVAEKLGIKEKLPENFVPTCSCAGKILPKVAENLGLSKDVIVTAGIHDSNASLLPYLSNSSGKDFILNSTGTWCVLMHPLKKDEKAFCSDDEIGKAVFFNRSALDQPVKTAIFLGGMELDFYVKLFKKINKTEDFPKSDIGEIQKILEDKNTLIFPEPIEKSKENVRFGILENGKFYPKNQLLEMSLSSSPEIDFPNVGFPSVLKNEKRFFASLVISMAIQTEIALRRVGIKSGTEVFTEGGFRKNLLYNKLIASVFPENDFYLTDIAEATALGSAMSAMLAMEKASLPELSKYVAINKTKIVPEKISGYEEYKQIWLNEQARRK